MEQPVQDRGREDLVVEDLAPVQEALVAREDKARPLVATRQEPEEQARLVPGEREIADLVEDEDLRVDELFESPLEPSGPRRRASSGMTGTSKCPAGKPFDSTHL